MALKAESVKISLTILSHAVKRDIINYLGSVEGEGTSIATVNGS
jgi:hypothetical protein